MTPNCTAIPLTETEDAAITETHGVLGILVEMHTVVTVPLQVSQLQVRDGLVSLCLRELGEVKYPPRYPVEVLQRDFTENGVPFLSEFDLYCLVGVNFRHRYLTYAPNRLS